jgi:hypothetical protein
MAKFSLVLRLIWQVWSRTCLLWTLIERSFKLIQKIKGGGYGLTRTCTSTSIGLLDMSFCSKRVLFPSHFGLIYRLNVMVVVYTLKWSTIMYFKVNIFFEIGINFSNRGKIVHLTFSLWSSSTLPSGLLVSGKKLLIGLRNSNNTMTFGSTSINVSNVLSEND